MARGVIPPFFFKLLTSTPYFQLPAVKKPPLVSDWKASNVLLLMKILNSIKLTRRNALSKTMIGMTTKNAATTTTTTNGTGITGTTRKTNAARCNMTGTTTKSAASTTSTRNGATTTKTSTTSRSATTRATTGMITRSAASIRTTISGITRIDGESWLQRWKNWVGEDKDSGMIWHRTQNAP